jgi:hypothetical protein
MRQSQPNTEYGPAGRLNEKVGRSMAMKPCVAKLLQTLAILLLTIPLSSVPALAWENQIDSFDDWAATGWHDGADPCDPNLMLQGTEANEVYEGTGTIMVKCGLMHDPDAWDVKATKIFDPALDLTAAGNGVAQTALRLWFYTDPNRSGFEQIYAINVSSTNGGYAVYEVGPPVLSGWREVAAPITDFVDDPYDEIEPVIDFNLINEIQIHVTSFPEAGKTVYIDDLRLSDDANQPPLLGQIDSFDNWAATGWSDPCHPELMEQAGEADSKEGTGCLRVKCEDMYPEAWDVHATRIFDSNLDMTAIGNGVEQTALRLWFYTNPNAPFFEQIYAINVSSANGGFAYYEVGTPAVNGWREVVAPIADFVDDANEFEPPIDFNNITEIDIHVTSYPEAGESVYIDDLRLSADANQPSFLGQIDSFDDWEATGWNEDPWTGLMVQAPESDSYEGTGCIRVKCEDMAEGWPGWDVYAMKDFGEISDAGYDMTAAGNRVEETALRLWLYSDGVADERIYRIDLSSTNQGWAVYEVGYTLKTGWQEIIAPIKAFVNDPDGGAPNDVDFSHIYNIAFLVTSYPVAGDSIYIDDLRLSDDAYIPFEGQIIDADYATIAVDADPCDWEGLNSEVISMDLQSLPSPEDNGNLNVDYRLAWDEDYLYILIEEQSGDDLATEAPDLASMTDREGVAYDSLSMFFDFDSDGSRNNTGAEANLDYWLFLGLSSTSQTDLMMVWTKGVWGSHDPSAVANSSVATSGTLGSRIIEVGISWEDVNDVLTDTRQPEGGLLNAIGPGFVFGADPRLADIENSDEPYNTTKGGAWFHGGLWGAPSGNDEFSTDVQLICGSAADLDGDCETNFLDFAILAARWLDDNCSAKNNWCNRADLEPKGHPDGDVDMADLDEFVSYWLGGDGS